MKELRGRVAVVTGAASGIGFALAERFAAEGMKLVLADVDRAALAAAEEAVARAGAEAVAVVTDVADGSAVAALAARTRERFGAAHVVCNNAGVGGAGGPIWTLTEKDWTWTLSVNLWGVIHGMRAFVPLLCAADAGHVVNTASMAGLGSPPFMGPYVASKHAVVAISEVLARDLEATGQGHVKVSVLCPGFVRTRIADSERCRPEALRNGPATEAAAATGATLREMIRAQVEAGIAPGEVADHVVAAIREERFYVLPHPEMKAMVGARMQDILQERYPRFRPIAP
jgi:NAD(P)-dependent dehydrogenase (short-subunit alcohol dehydrogenase family)